MLKLIVKFYKVQLELCSKMVADMRLNSGLSLVFIYTGGRDSSSDIYFMCFKLTFVTQNITWIVLCILDEITLAFFGFWILSDIIIA